MFLIRVHLETGYYKPTVVGRFQVAFIWEIWLPVRETGRFALYPEDSRIIWESWHACNPVPVATPLGLGSDTKILLQSCQLKIETNKQSANFEVAYSFFW